MIKTDREEADPTQLREEASLTVNEPFRGRQFAANKKLTEEERTTLENALAEDEVLQFAVVGDFHFSRWSRLPESKLVKPGSSKAISQC